MRPVTLTDLSAAARVLMATPAEQRMDQAYALIAQAHSDDLARRGALAKASTPRGNGSLLSAALSRPRESPIAPGDRNYLQCLHLMLGAVLTYPGGK